MDLDVAMTDAARAMDSTMVGEWSMELLVTHYPQIDRTAVQDETTRCHELLVKYLSAATDAVIDDRYATAEDRAAIYDQLLDELEAELRKDKGRDARLRARVQQCVKGVIARHAA